MILDHLVHHHLYTNPHPLFSKAFDYLLRTDLSTLDLGRHDIAGEDLFMILMEYESKNFADCKMENHKKFIDIQYMVQGEELIAISSLDHQIPTETYDEARDVAFYKNDYSSMLRLQQGQFAIFFPHDLHMPCIRAEQSAYVKKAVFKIKRAESNLV